MDRKKKIGLAVLVVAIGAVLALQFRKTDSPVTPSEATAAAQSAGATTTSSDRVAPWEDFASKSGSSFAGRIESAPSDAAPASGSDVNKGFIASPSAANRDDIDPDRALVDLNQPDKIHKIVDGDTLAKLAQRYWGRADRYVDLYAYNRDVLSDPDVLPIGAELRVPAHIVASSDPDLAPTAPVLPLVPLPRPAPGAPAVAAAASATPPSQRTYKVQPGDNLVDIARKFYGDGRKHTALFEANRRVMRTPTDLKPGTLLVIP